MTDLSRFSWRGDDLDFLKIDAPSLPPEAGPLGDASYGNPEDARQIVGTLEENGLNRNNKVPKRLKGLP